jgi:hypothetical protein
MRTLPRTVHHSLPRTFITLVTSVVLGGIACERSTSPSAAGTVPVRLVSQFTDDGAALIEFTGNVQSVSAPAGTLAYTEQKGGGIIRVLLVRETPGRIEFTLHLANRSTLPTSRVLEVSDAVDRPRTDVGAYRVEY